MSNTATSNLLSWKRKQMEKKRKEQEIAKHYVTVRSSRPIFRNETWPQWYARKVYPWRSGRHRKFPRKMFFKQVWPVVTRRYTLPIRTNVSGTRVVERFGSGTMIQCDRMRAAIAVARVPVHRRVICTSDIGKSNRAAVANGVERRKWEEKKGGWIYALRRDVTAGLSRSHCVEVVFEVARSLRRWKRYRVALVTGQEAAFYWSMFDKCVVVARFFHLPFFARGSPWMFLRKTGIASECRSTNLYCRQTIFR